MKKLALALIASLAMSGTALAATDLGDGACQQTDGQTGLWNGTTADDDGCVTLAEYEAMYGDPEAIVVSVDPVLEPEAPTVREYFESPLVRAERLGLTIE